MGHWTKTGKTATTYEVRAPGSHGDEFVLVRTKWAEAEYQSAVARTAGGRVFVCWEAPGRQAASLEGFHKSAKDALNAAGLEYAQRAELARLDLERAEKGLAFARSLPRARTRPSGAKRSNGPTRRRKKAS